MHVQLDGDLVGVVTAQIPETYQWLLVPVQSSPQAAVEWQTIRVSGQDPLAVRASRKLRNDELLLTVPGHLREILELLDRVQQGLQDGGPEELP